MNVRLKILYQDDTIRYTKLPLKNYILYLICKLFHKAQPQEGIKKISLTYKYPVTIVHDDIVKPQGKYRIGEDEQKNLKK